MLQEYKLYCNYNTPKKCDRQFNYNVIEIQKVLEKGFMNLLLKKKKKTN